MTRAADADLPTADPSDADRSEADRPEADRPEAGRTRITDAAPGTVGPDRDQRVFGVGNWRIAAETAVVAAITWAFVAVLYRLWDADLHRPIANTAGDMTQVESWVKTLVQTGWINNQPRLGAPFGQVNYDFPQGGESLQWVVMKFFSLFTSSSGLIVNLYYLAGFGLVSIVVYLILRHLRFGPLVSAAVTLPYTFLTFHFVHGEQHLTRSTYLSIPLACLLLIWLPTWRHRFLRDPDRAPGVDPWHNLRWKRVAFALGVCVFIGAWETMTTAFALSLLFVSAVVGAIRWHEWRRLVVGAVGIAVIAVTFVVVSSPSLLYWHRHGSNPVAGHRVVAEAELYGLKLNRLVLPADGSRLHFLQVLGDKSQAQTPVITEGGQSIGILFVLGFFGALFAAVAGVRRARAGRRSDPRRPDDREAMRETIGLVVIAAIVLGTVGGFSTILSMIGFAQIRAWNRISPFIAFFALLQLLLWSERLVPWARQRWSWSRPVLAIAAIAACVLTIALGPPVQPVNPSAVANSFASDQTIVTQIEQVLPPGSNIMQVPYLFYPEEGNPPGTIQDYDPLRPFLADPTGNLNWSYGSLTGRPQADWQAKVTPARTAADLPALIGMGFTGLWVDTLGYTTDHQTLGQIQRALDEPPLRSPDGRFLFYDLRPLKARLHLSDAQLRALATKTFGIAPPS